MERALQEVNDIRESCYIDYFLLCFWITLNLKTSEYKHIAAYLVPYNYLSSYFTAIHCYLSKCLSLVLSWCLFIKQPEVLVFFFCLNLVKIKQPEVLVFYFCLNLVKIHFILIQSVYKQPELLVVYFSHIYVQIFFIFIY